MKIKGSQHFGKSIWLGRFSPIFCHAKLRAIRVHACFSTGKFELFSINYNTKKSRRNFSENRKISVGYFEKRHKKRKLLGRRTTKHPTLGLHASVRTWGISVPCNTEKINSHEKRYCIGWKRKECVPKFSFYFLSQSARRLPPRVIKLSNFLFHWIQVSRWEMNREICRKFPQWRGEAELVRHCPESAWRIIHADKPPASQVAIGSAWLPSACVCPKLGITSEWFGGQTCARPPATSCLCSITPTFAGSQKTQDGCPPQATTSSEQVGVIDQQKKNHPNEQREKMRMVVWSQETRNLSWTLAKTSTHKPMERNYFCGEDTKLPCLQNPVFEHRS